MRSIYMTLFLFAVMAQGCASAVAPSSGRATPAPLRSESVHVSVAATVAASSAPETSLDTPPAPPEVLPGTADRDQAVAWMVHFMTRNAPPGRQTFYVEAQETKEEALTRYNEIANAIVDIVYDPDTKPLFRGSSGRTRTASVILAIMLHESGFMKNVDFGVGKYGRGDHGNSWCLLQLNVGSMGTGHTMKWNTKEDRTPRLGDDPKDIFEGNTGPELVKDRHNCIREGLKAMRVSFTACSSNPLEERLNVYASGHCDEGAEGSRIRMKTAVKFWDDTKAERTFSDKAILAYVNAQRQLDAVPKEAPLPFPVQPNLPDPAKEQKPSAEPVPVAQTDR